MTHPAPAFAYGKWVIYRNTINVNEYDYSVMCNEKFFCRTNSLEIAIKIVRAIGVGK